MVVTTLAARSERGLIRGVLGLAEPEPTGDHVWDAAIAALVAWRLREDGLPVPDWMGDASRHLALPSPLAVDPADPTPPLSEVPEHFAEHGVLVWRDTFASV